MGEVVRGVGGWEGDDDSLGGVLALQEYIGHKPKLGFSNTTPKIQQMYSPSGYCAVGFLCRAK